jgi:hypothetical protein
LRLGDFGISTIKISLKCKGDLQWSVVFNKAPHGPLFERNVLLSHQMQNVYKNEMIGRT